MKTLLLLRHAKSSWKDPDLPDHDRPLNKRGKRAAPRIGQLLRKQHLHPDVIISSTAKRARKTAAKVAKKCGYEGIIELDGDLYLATPDTYLQTLHNVSNQNDSVLLVGHNPGLEQLLHLLTGIETRLPTAALALVQLEIDSWRELTTSRRGQLIEIWRPRELNDIA